MPTDVIVETAPEPIEISMSDIRAAMADAPVETEAKPEAPEIKTEPVETKPEPESGTGEKKQEPESVEEELPEGVKKRIAREVEKTARYQAEIDRAVSQTKAKEAELKKLTTGPEPEKKTTETASTRPARPNIETFEGTLAEYNRAVKEYDSSLETWLFTEARRVAETEFRTNLATQESKRKWDEALQTHAELPQMAEVVTGSSPEGLQLAISALGDWAGVTVHLGKHPDELATLTQQFQANPYVAVAALGKLEDRLKPATKQAEVKTQALPEPLKPVGGTANAATPKVDLETADFGAFKAEVRRQLKAG